MALDLVNIVEAAGAAGLPVIYTVNTHDDLTNTQAWKQRHKEAGAGLVDDCLAAANLEEHQATLTALEKHFDAVVVRAADLVRYWQRARLMLPQTMIST